MYVGRYVRTCMSVCTAVRVCVFSNCLVVIVLAPLLLLLLVLCPFLCACVRVCACVSAIHKSVLRGFPLASETAASNLDGL